MVLFIMLYKVVASFETVDEIRKWDHYVGQHGCFEPMEENA